jgi:hypothetical protein
MLGLGMQINKYNAPSNFLLNKIVGDVIAFSIRKINDRATKCIRVRRGSDNAESDIGFLNGTLDTVSLLAFTGAGNGFIRTWYDQSGNGNNAIQLTAGNQPQIVASGVVTVNTNNKIAVKAISASNTYLSVAYNSAFNVATNMSINAVHDPSTTGGGGNGRILTKNDTSDYAFYLGSSNVMRMSATTNSVSQAYALNTVNISTAVVNGNSTADFYWKGASAGQDTSIQATTTGNNDLLLFNRSAIDRNYDGYISEIIIFNNQLSTVNRNTIERNQASYYGVTLL